MNYKILLDSPEQKPKLRFPEYAAAFKGIIENSDPRFAIGIFGGWGSGKTTLMEAIRTSLDASHVIAVPFSAWRYEKEQHLIVPLLDTIRDSLVSWARQRETTAQATARLAMHTASTVGKVIYSLMAGISMKVGVPDTLEVSLEANKALAQATSISREDRDAEMPRSFYHASFRALSEAFAQFMGDDQRRRIVVFVDDLDRCLPEGALEVLESMKLFFDLPGFVFVVGLDRQVVETAIDAKYAGQRALLSEAGVEAERTAFRIRGSEYVKKIFQVPFNLPPVTVDQIPEYLGAICAGSSLPAAQQTELLTTVGPHLRYVFPSAGLSTAASVGVNPREIKRYINTFTLSRVVNAGPSAATLDSNVMLMLQTLSLRDDWAVIREALAVYRQIFVNELREYMQGKNSSQLRNLDTRLENLPQDFVEYIADGGPAHAILDVHSIDEYIYAGETTSSETGLHSADLIRALTQLRAALAEASEATDPNAPELQQLIAHLQPLQSLAPKVGESEVVANVMRAGLSELETDLRKWPPRDAAGWRREWEDWTNQQIGYLLRRR